MARRFPPLNQLRAFEAAARHQSFKDAAEELNVTHAAVSHQIKALEEYLGQKLFLRLTRSVQITDDAKDFAEGLGNAFDQIAQATQSLNSKFDSGPLMISSAPFYGNRILLPRLSNFLASDVGFPVQVSLDFDFVEFADGKVAAAVRYGLGDWPGLEIHLLHHDILSPVCAPQLAENLEFPLTLAGLSRLSMANAESAEDDWSIWFAAAGINIQPDQQFVYFDNRALALDFALSGNGIALADMRMVNKELMNGHLVRLHPLTIDGNRAMYLVHPKNQGIDRRIDTFGRWVFDVADTIDTTVGLPPAPIDHV